MRQTRVEPRPTKAETLGAWRIKGARDLPPEISKKGSRPRLQVSLGSIADVEAKHIRKVLRSVEGNKKRAAEILGISRETLYQKLKLYEIPK